ncbi:hypothetical protein HDV01_004582 [Terramyces sp. JEL0728]|nr:hypothetical protein HDV01_004582 [Terramyces sp. JEL0728]
MNDSELAYRLLKLGSDMKSPCVDFYSTDTLPSQSSETVCEGEYDSTELNLGQEYMLEYLSGMTSISKDFLIKQLQTSTVFNYGYNAAFYFHHDFPDFESKTNLWLDKTITIFPKSFSSPTPATVLASLILGGLHFSN